MAKGRKQSTKPRMDTSEPNGTFTRNDWRKAGMTREQHKYCANIIKSLKQYKHVGPFLDPVDPIKLNVPDYFDIVKKPMDLGTVERRLNSCEYESTLDFAEDVRLIFSNCYLYNGEKATISQFARDMEEIFNRSFEKMPGESVLGTTSQSSPVPKLQKPQKIVEQPVMKPLSEPKRPKREIRPPPSKDLPDTPTVKRRKLSKKNNELNFCRGVLRELKKKQHYPYAYPFYEPVDAQKLQVPDYYIVIKQPRDIQTISNKLESDQYESAQAFEADIRLMFQNCYTYNPVGSDVYRMGKQLEAVFDKKWKEKPVSSTRPTSPDHPEESTSDSEEDDSQAHLKALQKHLAALQSQIASMRKPSKTKPRKNSSKTTKEPSRRNSTKSVKDVQTKKQSKRPRSVAVPKLAGDSINPAPLTVEQKNDLSERINRLREDKMGELIQLIRDSGAPLESEDGSYELEIESVDAVTARKIYEFVLKNTSKPKKQPPAKKQRVAYDEEENQRQIDILESQLRKFDEVNNVPAESHSPAASPMYPEYTNYVSHEETSESESETDSSGSESEDSAPGLSKNAKAGSSGTKRPANTKSKPAQKRMANKSIASASTANAFHLEQITPPRPIECAPEVRKAVLSHYYDPFAKAEEERKAALERQIKEMEEENRRMEREEAERAENARKAELERKAAEEKRQAEQRAAQLKVDMMRREALAKRQLFKKETESKEFLFNQVKEAEDYWKENEYDIYEFHIKKSGIFGSSLPFPPVLQPPPQPSPQTHPTVDQC